MIKTLCGMWALALPMTVCAGTVTSPVSWVQVYPGTDIVYLRTAQQPTSQPTCKVHPNVHYAFSLASPRGKETYAAVLTAKATGATLNVVGTNTCTWHSQVEDVLYVVIQ